MTTPLYEINVANKMGHQTLQLALAEAVDTLLGFFKENKKWIFINDAVFIPKAKFNGSAEDDVIVAEDKTRLATILEGATSVDVSVPGGFAVPSINVAGELKGGSL